MPPGPGPERSPRRPAVAGSFYPSSPAKLRESLEASFRSPRGPGRLPTPEGKGTEPPLVGGIVPHAGYVYSGPTAAHFYERLSRTRSPPTFVLLGVNHHGIGAPLAVCDRDWETPLGVVRTDPELLREVSRTLAIPDAEAHAQEHSLEVELPFLQFLYPSGRLRVIGLQVTFVDFPTLHSWGRGLREAVGEREAVYLASTDLSHYLPREEAREKDARVLEALRSLSAKELYRRVVEEGISMCGVAPVTMLLSALEGLPVRAQLLARQDSADAEPMDRVVGYASFALERGRGPDK